MAPQTNEIGIRMALGARDVIGMVLRDSLRMVGAGILIGLPCAYAVATILEMGSLRWRRGRRLTQRRGLTEGHFAEE